MIGQGLDGRQGKRDRGRNSNVRTLEVVWGRKMFAKFSIYNAMGIDLSKCLHILNDKEQKVHM